jgi:hypothetical protein
MNIVSRELHLCLFHPHQLLRLDFIVVSVHVTSAQLSPTCQDQARGSTPVLSVGYSQLNQSRIIDS